MPPTPSRTPSRAGRSRPPQPLSEREQALVALFRAIRFAETGQLAAAFVPDPFPSPHKLRLRLGRLERLGYLDRPARRIRERHAPDHELLGEKPLRGRPQDVWALAQGGAALLHLPGDWNRNNGRLRPTSFNHPLMVTQVYLTLYVAAATGLIDLERWVGESRWKTRVTVEGTPLPLVPDATFILADNRTDRTTTVFLEADNDTAPLTRSTLVQTSFVRKCRAYWHYWRDVVRPREQPMIVLTVAKTAARAEALRRTAEEADEQRRGLNLFWFASEEAWTIAQPERFLYEPIWTTAAGEARALFSRAPTYYSQSNTERARGNGAPAKEDSL